MWLQHLSFKDCFRSWRRGFQGVGWEGHKFMRKLQFVKVKLKEWNKEFFGVLKERKKSILSDIANIDVEQEGVLSSELSTQRALRKGELEELVLREEVHWRQKAKQKKKKKTFFLVGCLGILGIIMHLSNLVLLGQLLLFFMV